MAVIAVRGLGGMGKSQLALEYAHRAYATSGFLIVWWIRADTAVTLHEDLASLAEVLGAKRNADRHEAALSAPTLLSGRDDWLLIFDNARGSEEIRPWLPAGPGGVIVTSRNRGWGSIATKVPLERFRRRESLRYLRLRIARYDRTSGAELADTLGDLPLALAQAASYLDLYDLTVDAYLRRYANRRTAGALLAGSACVGAAAGPARVGRQPQTAAGHRGRHRSGPHRPVRRRTGHRRASRG